MQTNIPSTDEIVKKITDNLPIHVQESMTRGGVMHSLIFAISDALHHYLNSPERSDQNDGN
ncbi:MAG: hypothetical protein JWN30_848 [Bacilli bacterium]|nr:hypothetical protein [Bacilli bacterium]